MMTDKFNKTRWFAGSRLRLNRSLVVYNRRSNAVRTGKTEARCHDLADFRTRPVTVPSRVGPSPDVRDSRGTPEAEFFGTRHRKNGSSSFSESIRGVRFSVWLLPNRNDGETSATGVKNWKFRPPHHRCRGEGGSARWRARA